MTTYLPFPLLRSIYYASVVLHGFEETVSCFSGFQLDCIEIMQSLLVH